MSNYTTHIKSKTGWFDINLAEVFQYKYLIYLFFKRNYVTRYKQTILGPLWLVLKPLMTVTLYAFVFGNLAGLSTNGIPPFVFYLCSNSLWTFFSTCLTQTSNTFTANAYIMGKVYFPRLVMPISSVITGAFDLLIQLAMLAVIMFGYIIAGYRFNVGVSLLLVPVILLQASILGLGCGIIVASLTTKYRDLVVLVGFGVQLWMYATPVVYSLEIVPDKYQPLYLLNPMASMIECWRYSIIGSEYVHWGYLGLSWVVTLLVFFLGVLLFCRVEKVFMDTV